MANIGIQQLKAFNAIKSKILSSAPKWRCPKCHSKSITTMVRYDAMPYVAKIGCERCRYTIEKTFFYPHGIGNIWVDLCDEWERQYEQAGSEPKEHYHELYISADDKFAEATKMIAEAEEIKRIADKERAGKQHDE